MQRHEGSRTTPRVATPAGARWRATLFIALVVIAAVCVLERAPGTGGACASAAELDDIVARATAHLRGRWMAGSDPGLCVTAAESAAVPALIAFGRRAAIEVVTRADARLAAAGAHLSGHGGTEDGIIGAAADGRSPQPARRQGCGPGTSPDRA